MISDNDLYHIAIFLGSIAMMLIVVYHFLEVNAKDDDETEKTSSAKGARSGASNNGAKISGDIDAALTDGVPLTAAAAAAGGSSAVGGGRGR